MRRAWAALVLLAGAVALLGGCDSGGRGELTQEEDEQAERVIIEAEDGAFNAEAVYRRAAPGVVTVRSLTPSNDGISPGAGGQGSGFVLNEEGEIATNAHVVSDGDAGGQGSLTTASEVYVQFPDRNQVEAEIVGVDPFADIALLKVDPEGIDLTPLELGDVDDLNVGEPVAAIGSPFGERQSLSVGVISATDRSIPSLTQFSIDGAIQTDASINPGNSGGPLLDAEGRVIGVNQQIDTTSGGNQGVGFAVPIDLVVRSLEQLREDGEAVYAYIGVETMPLYPQLAERLGVDAETGALIADIVPGGPADEAGLCCKEGEGDGGTLRFQGVPVNTGGDVIVAVNGERIVAETDLSRVISRLKPGEVVTLEVIRGKRRADVEVELGERPG